MNSPNNITASHKVLMGIYGGIWGVFSSLRSLHVFSTGLYWASSFWTVYSSIRTFLLGITQYLCPWTLPMSTSDNSSSLALALYFSHGPASRTAQQPQPYPLNSLSGCNGKQRSKVMSGLAVSFKGNLPAMHCLFIFVYSGPGSLSPNCCPSALFLDVASV